MKAKETTFLINYKPVLIGAIAYMVLGLFPFASLENIEIVLLPLAFIAFVFVLLAKSMTFYRITITDTAVKTTPWFGKETVLFTADEIKTLTLKKSDSIATCEIIVNTVDGAKSHHINLFAYVEKGKNTKDSIAHMSSLLENLVDKTSNPERITNITKIEENVISNTETGSAIRWFVWLGLLAYALKMYVDMMVIQGIHFNTIEIAPYAIGFGCIAGLFCFLNMRMRMAMKAIDYLTPLLVGVALGWVFSGAFTSFIQWDNENKPQSTAQYAFVLDDYDEPRKAQRWLVSDKAQQIIPRERLYLYDRQRGYQLNTKLEENKTYSIPVAVGKFNDVFLPKDAFLKAKQINDQ